MWLLLCWGGQRIIIIFTIRMGSLLSSFVNVALHWGQEQLTWANWNVMCKRTHIENYLCVACMQFFVKKSSKGIISMKITIVLAWIMKVYALFINFKYIIVWIIAIASNRKQFHDLRLLILEIVSNKKWNTQMQCHSINMIGHTYMCTILIVRIKAAFVSEYPKYNTE